MKKMIWLLVGAMLAAGAYVSVVISGEMIDTEYRENDGGALLFVDQRT